MPRSFESSIPLLIRYNEVNPFYRPQEIQFSLEHFFETVFLFIFEACPGSLCSPDWPGLPASGVLGCVPTLAPYRPLSQTAFPHKGWKHL